MKNTLHFSTAPFTGATAEDPAQLYSNLPLTEQNMCNLTNYAVHAYETSVPPTEIIPVMEKLWGVVSFKKKIVY